MTEILVEASPGEVRVVVLDGQTLQEYALWRPGRPDGVGDIYRGRVIAHVPAMAGAFVALSDSEGFLPDSEGATGAVAGALLTVRIVRAGQGGKGPRLGAASAAPGEPGLVSRGPTPLEAILAAHPGVTPKHGPFPPALADEIAALAEPHADLPAGMRAHIYPTPALVAIDLDMGSATASRQPKATGQMAANLAALPALARQLRLRNLSGAILIDPAGLSLKRRPKLAPALASALAADPLKPQLLGFTALGLAEIVRRRVRPPLHELLSGPHAAGLAALRAIDREAAATPYAAFGLTCAPDVAAALARDPVALADLAGRTGRPLIPRPDPALSPGAWRIERPD
ncbi:MAG: ribonuclease E/G [Acetobacteraceae bacterium]|nr:ribonuclease E/G [Acetobacteraceae bacterium]